MKVQPPYLLIAEDDPDDRLIILEAIQENKFEVDVKFVHDGQELIEFLESTLANIQDSTLPSVILLDLNMPRIDGRQALKFVKSKSQFKKIPTIVLTTSSAAEDVEKAYKLGVNSFIVKPTDFSSMVQITDTINKYWLKTVKLPT